VYLYIILFYIYEFCVCVRALGFLSLRRRSPPCYYYYSSSSSSKAIAAVAAAASVGPESSCIPVAHGRPLAAVATHSSGHYYVGRTYPARARIRWFDADAIDRTVIHLLLYIFIQFLSLHKECAVFFLYSINKLKVDRLPLTIHPRE